MGRMRAVSEKQNARRGRPPGAKLWTSSDLEYAENDGADEG